MSQDPAAPADGAAPAAAAADPATEQGKALFESNCTSCHTLGQDGAYPDLVGVTKRRKPEWLKSWIKAPQKMIDAGDPTAKELFAKYGKSGVMSNFDGLPDADLDQIIAYLAVAQPGAAAPADGAMAADGAKPAEAGTSSKTVNIVLGVVLAALSLIVIILVILSSLLTKHLKEKEGKGELSEEDLEYVKQKHSVMTMIKSRTFIGIALAVVFAFGSSWLLHDVIWGIGVQTGYHPTQPIQFSHKLHAGKLEIDCNYCHTGVRKAKHANIPSGSICMNCHSVVNNGNAGLQYLYDAMGFDFEKKTYDLSKQRPIEWVRVHNLPDHVYFNHAQHVKVGGVECEECHGPVKDSMETAWQYSTLTMGWCVDCHRKKALNTDNNAYYDKLVKLHEKKGEGDFTVEKNGGLECARCHY